MPKIKIMTDHSDRTGADYYREFDLLGYGDDLPEGEAVEVKADPGDHSSVWSEFPGLQLYKITEPDGGVRYAARPEGRYQLYVEAGCITELYDDRDTADAEYRRHVDAGEACSLYDDKLHKTIAAYDPEED